MLASARAQRTHPSLSCNPFSTFWFRVLQALEEQDIIVEFMRLHWGLKEANPVSRVSTVQGSSTPCRMYSSESVFVEVRVRFGHGLRRRPGGTLLPLFTGAGAASECASATAMVVVLSSPTLLCNRQTGRRVWSQGVGCSSVEWKTSLVVSAHRQNGC